MEWGAFASSRAIRFAIAGVGIAVGLIGEAIAYSAGRPASEVVLDLAIGWTYLFGGLVIWGREPANRTGRLMTLVGLTWFLGSLTLSPNESVQNVGIALSDVPTVLMIALVLAYPTGRLVSGFDRAALVVIVVAATALNTLQLVPFPIIVNQNPNGLYVGVGIGILSCAVILRRWLLASEQSRRELLPVLVAGGVLLVLLLVNLVRRIVLLPDDVGALMIAAKDLAPAAIPIALLLGFYRQSELRLRALVDAIPDALVRLRRDADGSRFRAVDQAAADGLVGATDILAATADEAIQTGRLVSRDFSIGLPSGPRQFEARLAPSGADEVTAIVRDFTTQRAAEEELRRAPARLVEAADAERRRLERDLHDGAQQRLVTIALSLRVLRGQLARPDGSNDAAIESADRLAGELSAALSDLRELARGIHPVILTEAGLGPAIASLAERSDTPAVVVALPERRLGEAVEATAYFVVSEALANVAKYASARKVTISATCPDRTLRVEVRDDGVGGAALTRGSGLRGLRDRAASLGGRLTIDSPPGRGTSVVAEIPIA